MNWWSWATHTTGKWTFLRVFSMRDESTWWRWRTTISHRVDVSKAKFLLSPKLLLLCSSSSKLTYSIVSNAAASLLDRSGRQSQSLRQPIAARSVWSSCWHHRSRCCGRSCCSQWHRHHHPPRPPRPDDVAPTRLRELVGRWLLLQCMVIVRSPHKSQSTQCVGGGGWQLVCTLYIVVFW